MTNDIGLHNQSFSPRLSLQEVTESLALEEVPTRVTSELRPISDRIPGSPLRVPARPSRFLLSSQPTRDEPINLSLQHIVELIHNFSSTFMIGEGNSAKLYRAEKEHFVSLRAEFNNKIALLKTIDHRNLVKLLGYIDQGSERILISEYVSNGTLREHLDGEHGLILGFNQRLEIAIDVAHGLTYLHLYAEKPIIHGDLKSSNILLSESFRAKVADFGFARIAPTEIDQSQIEINVRGTAGYVDPEYLMTNHSTIKSDVFAYGILLLEILSGRYPIKVRRAARERFTVRWAFAMYNRGEVKDLLDPLLLTEAVNEDALNKIFDLAFQCVAPTRNDRPHMREVAESLWKIRRDHAKSHRTAEVILPNS